MATAQEAVRRLTIVTSAPGADQAAASLRGVAKAQDAVTVSSQSVEKATLSLDQKFASIERKYVSQVRAQQDYEKIQRQVNAAVAQNPALQERANTILAAAKDRHDQLTNSQRAAAKVSEDLTSQVRGYASALGPLGDALSALGPTGVAAAAGLGAVTLALYAASDAALKLADTAGKLKDFSETTGFTVVQLQALQKAGAQVGVSAESVSRGLERFSVAMDDIKKGVGPAFENILEINPALAQQLRQVNSLTDGWDIFAKAVKQADLEQANKLARSVFGRSGVEITRLARANSDAGGIAGVTDQLKEIDRITAAQAERWDELGDKISENMKAAKQDIAAIFTEPVLNALLKFSEGFLTVAQTAKGFTMSEDLKRYLQTYAQVMTGMIPVIGPTVSGAIGVAGTLSGSGSGASSAPAKPAGPSFVDRWGDMSTGPATGIDTARLDAQKRALAGSIAEQERWSAALGAAVTPADNLRMATDKLKLAQLENKISAEQAAKGQAVLNAQYASSQFSTYIGLLGQAASVEEQVQAKRNQINDAARQGVHLTKDQIATQLQLTRSQALGTLQIDAATDAEKVRGRTLLMTEQAAIAYNIVQTRINDARARGAPLSEGEIADLQRSADAFAKTKTQVDLYANSLALVTDGFREVGKAIVTAFVTGKSVSDALVSSLDNVADKLANSGFDNLLSGNPAQMGIGAVQLGASALISAFTGDQKAKKELQEAQAAWAKMAGEVTKFNQAAAGVDLGPLTNQLQSLFSSFASLEEAARKAEDEGARTSLAQTLSSGIGRIITEFKNGADDLSPLEKAIKGVRDEATGLKDTLTQIGTANHWDVAGEFAGIDAAVQAQIRKLMADAADTLTSSLAQRLNTALGKGYLNDATALLKQHATDLSTAAELGNDPAVLAQISATFGAEAQKIIQDAGLVGDQFQDFIALFPDLAGVVHEATIDITDSIKTISQYLESLQVGSKSVLSPQEQLAAAQAQFSQQIALAQGGNVDALGAITKYADTLLDQARNFYGSSEGYAGIYQAVESALSALIGASPSTATSASSTIAAPTVSTSALAPQVSQILSGGSSTDTGQYFTTQTQTLVQALGSSTLSQIQAMNDNGDKIASRLDRLIATMDNRGRGVRPSAKAAGG